MLLEAGTAPPTPDPQEEVRAHLTFLQSEWLSRRRDGPEVITIQAAQGLYQDGSSPAKIGDHDHSLGIHRVHYPAPGQREGGKGGLFHLACTVVLDKEGLKAKANRSRVLPLLFLFLGHESDNNQRS